MKRSLLVLFFFFALFAMPILHTSAAAPIKILLVPGHDDEVWGAQYGNIKEADMTLALATKIFNILKKDKRFEVHITRDSVGYTKEFADYFTNHEKDILAFKENAKKQMKEEVANGGFVQKANTPHHGVTADVAIKLYGINKWANENKMDAVVHIHFNDYPRDSKWTIGQYKGFTIYIPDGQLPNWRESGQLGADIFSQLHKKYSISTYKPESAGLTSDQKLIAVGASGTLDDSVRSVLIEYGYIYEKKFRNTTTRHQAYADMAALTSTGINNYFFPIKKIK